MAEKRVKSFKNKCCNNLSVFSRAFPQNPSLTPTRIPSWQLEDDGPDLLAKTVDGTSGNGSSISEIEMINSDSNEQSGEENQ